MPAHDLTITWTWTINNHSITYYVDGVITWEVENYNYGTEITRRAEPSKEWYTFSHWDVELPATMPDNDIVVSGHFIINQYHVSFVDWDGRVLSGADYDYGTASGEIVLPEDPEREGYTFVGWIWLPDNIPAHDVTWTASYTINSYTVTYAYDGNVPAWVTPHEAESY